MQHRNLLLAGWDGNLLITIAKWSPSETISPTTSSRDSTNHLECVHYDNRYTHASLLTERILEVLNLYKVRWKNCRHSSNSVTSWQAEMVICWLPWSNGHLSTSFTHQKLKGIEDIIWIGQVMTTNTQASPRIEESSKTKFIQDSVEELPTFPRNAY